LVSEIALRLEFLDQVGLGYLTLERGAPTLSGGESQRIRLAAQLGSHLQGVCYVLDEPTIGLHARDNHMLLNALTLLCQKGNTLVVVEHDEETMRRADHLIDIGPGAGKRGGQLVAQGSVQDLMDQSESVTGRYLRDAMRHPLQARRHVSAAMGSKGKSGSAAVPHAEGASGALRLMGAALHNLKGVEVDFPLKRLVAVTGVSGSGKSTLARDILLANVQQALAHRKAPSQWLGCTGVMGWEQLDRVLEVDQTPIGKTPRSCPATYIGFWDMIRKMFAQTLEAQARGYGPSRFSFNTGEGRCHGCEGQGMRTIEMSFLPDVKVLCDVCKGARFNAETLSVTWRGKTIGDVLQMQVDEAVDFFASTPVIAHPLSLLKDVGLGYLTLGQPSPTLSGGEAQRIKLGSFLAKGTQAPPTLFIFDEPTTGLHFYDIDKLVIAFNALIDRGHSIFVIEHNMEVIKCADHIIELGPTGGEQGGHLLFEGTPEEMVKAKNTETAQFLAEKLHPTR
jgi:excinuclease ABC subunit A